MAFKASNVIPQVAYQTVKQAAVQLRLNLVAMISTLSSKSVDYDYLSDVYLTLKRANDQFNTLKATPGLAQFAKDQESDQAYDVAGEFTAMQGAITSAMGWIEGAAPATVNLKNPVEWGAGTLISNTVTSAQSAGLRAALQGVVDSIS